jgi:hypothetical protein
MLCEFLIGENILDIIFCCITGILYKNVQLRFFKLTIVIKNVLEISNDNWARAANLPCQKIKLPTLQCFTIPTFINTIGLLQVEPQSVRLATHLLTGGESQWPFISELSKEVTGADHCVLAAEFRKTLSNQNLVKGTSVPDEGYSNCGLQIY